MTSKRFQQYMTESLGNHSIVERHIMNMEFDDERDSLLTVHDPP